MNQLSWLIYLADVAGSTGFWIDACVFVAGAIVIISLIIAVAAEADNAMWKTIGRLQAFAIPIFILTLILSIAVPSMNTVYAIAASQIGEQVIKSPTMTRTMAGLEAWIDAQLPKPAPAAAPAAPAS